MVKSLRHAWPQAKAISKHHVFNIPTKVMKLLPDFKELNWDYEHFKTVVNSSDILNGIDNEVSLDDNEAYELAQSLWLEVARNCNWKRV